MERDLTEDEKGLVACAIQYRPVSAGGDELNCLPRQPGGFEGCVTVHIALDANHPSSPHRNDNCRLGFQLDPAASTAPVFVQEHNDVVASVDELLCLQAALFPRLQILSLERLVDLGQTVGYLALLKPADGAVELDLGIDQLCCLFLVPSQERLEGLPHELTFSGDIARAVSRAR